MWRDGLPAFGAGIVGKDSLATRNNKIKRNRAGPALKRQKLPSANQSEKIDGLQPYGYCASMEPTQATNVQHQLHNPAVYM